MPRGEGVSRMKDTRMSKEEALERVMDVMDNVDVGLSEIAELSEAVGSEVCNLQSDISEALEALEEIDGSDELIHQLRQIDNTLNECQASWFSDEVNGLVSDELEEAKSALEALEE